MIDQQKFEELLNKYADGTLAAELAAEVEAFMAAHPELLDDPTMRVTAPEVAMPGKESLKHKAAVASLWRYAAAACVAALIAAGLLLRPDISEPAATSLITVAQVHEPDEPAEPTEPTEQPTPIAPITPITPITTSTKALDPTVAPQPLLAAEPNIPAPKVIAATAAAKPRIIDTDALIAYSPDTVEVGIMVVYTSPLEGQPSWLEPVTTHVFDRLEDGYSRFEGTMLAVAEKAAQPITSIFRK